MAAMARFPEMMCVLTLHALLEQNLGTNPDARIYINKYGKASGLRAAAFCSTCNCIGLSVSSMVLVAHNYMKKDVIFLRK